MAFAPPASGNISSGVDFFNWINLTVDNWFIPGIVIAIFFIIMIKTYYGEQNMSKSFVAASFVSMILTVMFRVIDLVSTIFMVIFIIFTSIGVVWLYIENSRGAV